MLGRVLVIAGSDPSGGAGIQADIKTVTALGGYAMTAITSLTVQNTRGVKSVHPVAPAVIRDQIVACLEDIGADAIKIGMIGAAAAGQAILSGLKDGGWSRRNGAPALILDPVLVATSGHSLASGDMARFLRERFLPLADLVTPNADEAAALTGLHIAGLEDQKAAGAALLEGGAAAALIKGGHLFGSEVIDWLATPAAGAAFQNPRIETKAGHGTGCTLASAIATGLAQGMDLVSAIERAIAFVRDGLKTAPGLGSGAGPLNHTRFSSPGKAR